MRNFSKKPRGITDILPSSTDKHHWTTDGVFSDCRARELWPEEWPRWIQKFERIRQASGLHSKDEAKQVNTLIYSMGDAAADNLSSMNLSENDKKKYEPVKTKFNEHFGRGRNVIYECTKFNSHRQQDGETVDQFVIALHTLAENCSYGQLREEMIRDWLVVGLWHMQVSMKLQLDPELTLKRAVTAACQSEAVKHQQTVVRGMVDQSPNVDRVI